MNTSANLIVYPVSDTAKAKALFSKLLGVEPYAESPYYIGFRTGDQEIGLDPNGLKQGQTGPLCYFFVEDIKKSLQDLVDGGATVQQDVRDVGGGRLIAVLKDADGSPIGLLQNP